MKKKNGKISVGENSSQESKTKGQTPSAGKLPGKKKLPPASANVDVNFQTLIENSPDGIALITREGNYKYISQTARRIFGFNSDKDIITLPYDSTHPDDLPMVVDTLEKVIENPLLVPVIQYRFKNRDGSWHWIESTISNMLSKPGIESIVFNFHDITIRKNAEDELKNSEIRLRELIDNVDGLVWAVDRNYCLINSNARYQERNLTYFGREIEVGENILEMPGVSEDLRDEWMGYHARVMQGEQFSVERPNSFNVEAQIDEVMFKPIRNLENQIIGMAVVQRDITNRKKSEDTLKSNEEKFRMLLEMATDAFFQGNSKGELIMVNSKSTELTGYSKDELLQMRLSDLFTEREMKRKPLNYSILNRGQMLRIERDLKRKDNTLVKIEMHSRAMPDGTYQSFFRDITERRRSEAELEKQRRIFEQMFVQSATSTQILDPAGWCLRVNPKLCELFNVLPENIEGRVYNIFRDKEVKKNGIDKILKRVFENHTVEQWEVFFDIGEAADSQGIELEQRKKSWFANKAYPVLDEKGKLLNVIIQHEDISDRKRAEEALKESEDKFRTLAESAPYAIMIYQDDHWVYTNPEGEKITGYSAEELYQMTYWEVASDDYRKLIKERGKRRQKGKSSTPSYEFKIRTKDGQDKWVFLSGSTLLYRGKFAGIISVIDITKRKEAEDAIQRERVLLRTLIDHLPDTIYFKDNDCRKIVANRADLEFLGIKEEAAALGKTDIELFGENVGRRGFTEDKKVIKTGRPLINSEIEYTDANGKNRWLLTSKIPLHNEKSKVSGLVGIGHDITERKQAEKIQRVLFQISNAVLVTNDLEQLFKIIREQLGTLLDTTNFFIAFYDEETDMLSTPFYKDEKDKLNSWPAAKSATGYVIKHKKSLLVSKDEIEQLNSEGTIEIVGDLCQVWLGVPLLVENKAIGAIVVQSYYNQDAYTRKDVEMLEFVSHQISLSIQRKKAEQDIRDALVKAEESDRLKTAFLNNMSHEIRTPLNGILGFTSLLSDPDNTEEDKQYFYRIINQNGEQLLSIINDIISIATIEAGQEKIREGKVNVSEMLKMLYEQFKLQCAGKDLTLNYRLSLSPGQALIRTDETKLMQVLANLIGNAVKFTEAGMVEFVCNKKGSMLEFCVSDTGIGIKKGMHDVIFERFSQANMNPKKEYGGNGLGLAISKAYVELLGGKIWFESNPGKGSKFWFTIPHIIFDHSSDAKKSGNMNIPIGNGNGKTLLIAEDVYTNYQLLEAILKKMNYQIIHVENGIEAVNMCKSNPNIDLVLMDLKMPEMDGYEATGLIKKLRPGLPVIAVTAYALGGDKDKALNAGCDDYISKPVKAGALVEILYRFLAPEAGN